MTANMLFGTRKSMFSYLSSFREACKNICLAIATIVLRSHDDEKPLRHRALTNCSMHVVATPLPGENCLRARPIDV